jgi:Subtilase family/Domain of unknown function (DUF4062)
MKHIRVFLSSPGDVAAERDKAHEILTTLPQEPAWEDRISIQVVRWDNPHSPTPMYANYTPQEAVNRKLTFPSKCDLVVLILWSRFGTPLSEPRKPDGGNYRSGTEWEYHDALRANVPVLLYRRTSEPQISLRDKDHEKKKAQLDLVDEFFSQFIDAEGAATGGFVSYVDVTDFANKFKRVLESAVRQLLEAEDTKPAPSHAGLQSVSSLQGAIDQMSRELREKDQVIAQLRETLILRSTPAVAAPSADLNAMILGSDGETSTMLEVKHLTAEDAEALPRDPAVVAVAPVIPMKLIAPIEPFESRDMAGSAWGVAAVGADASPFTGRGAVVALLDTGIDARHPAFAGLQIVRKNFTAEDDADRHGHGTHFAGTVFGRSVDGLRIGVAPGVERALIAKVVGSKGAHTDAVLNALEWARLNGANIIAMSLSFDLLQIQRSYSDLGVPSPKSQSLQAQRDNARIFDSMFELMRRGALFGAPLTIIMAAGNESNHAAGGDLVSAVSAPADADGIISVAAVGSAPDGLVVAPFSNVGATLAAPGTHILSAAPGGGLRTLSGTSMAAAHVTGIAALWAEKLLKRGQRVTGLDANLLASTRRDRLKPGFVEFDVGLGVAFAPQ